MEPVIFPKFEEVVRLVIDQVDESFAIVFDGSPSFWPDLCPGVFTVCPGIENGHLFALAESSHGFRAGAVILADVQAADAYNTTTLLDRGSRSDDGLTWRSANDAAAWLTGGAGAAATAAGVSGGEPVVRLESVLLPEQAPSARHPRTTVSVVRFMDCSFLPVPCADVRSNWASVNQRPLQLGPF